MNFRKNLLLWVLAALLVLLAGCQQEPPADTTEATVPTQPIEQLSLVVTAENIHLLENYPSLKKADLSGSTCYDAILDFVKTHPKIEVTYTVQLDSLSVSSNATELVLDPGVCSYDTLAQNLQYLPKLTSVTLPRTTFSAQEITALEGLYPLITWDYTLILLGQEMGKDTTELNLSVLSPDRVQEAAEKLSLFPNVTTVELMDSYGRSELSMEDVKILMDGAPNADFHYVFQLFGRTVSTLDERIEFVQEPIGNEGEAELRRALAIMRGCDYLLLDDCGFDNEVLAKVREDFPETEVVWRIHVWKRSWLTDTDTIRAVYHVDDTNCEPFKYCTKTKYIDMGHNEELTDISFIAYMPDLEIVILSGSPIKDLTPFANATKLIFLELAFCGHIDDISPLAGCTSLENLNISYTKAKDMTALYELPLKQLCAVVSKIPWDEQMELMDLLPDCSFRFDGNQPYGTGWRYKKSGAYTEIYAKVREVFDLDAVDKLIAAGQK